MFNANVGSTDRIFRIVLGLILLAVTFFVVSGFWAAVAGLFGVIFLATGIIGWCPLYLAFNFSTRKA